MWFNDYLKPFGKNILYLGWIFTAAYLGNFSKKPCEKGRQKVDQTLLSSSARRPHKPNPKKIPPPQRFP